MYLRDNYYMRDFLRRLKNQSINSKVDRLIYECEQIDSIQDYQIFKKFVIEKIKSQPENGMLTKKEFGSEGLLYGHRDAFFKYAGIESGEQRFIFPYFEHGADLREKGILSVQEQGNHSFVFQAPYKNEMVHRVRPMSPVYNIGPYILYAKPYFNNETYSFLKKKNGRTALLFPAHTFEGASVNFDKKKFVKDVFDKFRNQYDTIMVSVYWNDVDDPIYEIFESEGAKLVSAGFRGDPNFIARQRAMIDLSDVVASNLTGSYIGYAMALNKPFYMFSDRATLTDASNLGNNEEERRYALTIDSMFVAFSSLTPSDEQIEQQRGIFEKFWGGMKHFKTVEEARIIINLSSKLLNACKGTTNGYEQVIKDTLKGGNKINVSDNEMIILLKSLNLDHKFQ